MFSRSNVGCAIYLSFVLGVFPAESICQGWGSVYSGTGAVLHDITFVGKHGWIAGKDGTILHSSNEGYTWTAQTSGTTSTLHSVSFVDTLNGWVVGEPVANVGTVLHTT